MGPKKPALKNTPPQAAVDTGVTFAKLLSDVTPLPPHGRVSHNPPPRKPRPIEQSANIPSSRADELSDHIASDVPTGDELRYLRNGLAQRTLKALRRGKWPAESELDLHGLTSSEARALLVEFLDECARNASRCVRIIHGKGLRSRDGEAVLKTKVANWLVQRGEVLAFCQARPAEGGAGAVVVLLKTRGF